MVCVDLLTSVIVTSRWHEEWQFHRNWWRIYYVIGKRRLDRWSMSTNQDRLPPLPYRCGAGCR